MAAGVKHIWTDEQIETLKQNFDDMNSYKLSAHVGITRTLVRMKCYELGLYRMTLEYWTDEQIQYLKDNYQTKGDTEIARHFNTIYNKAKGWSKKHIEKKRRYLNLQRTKAEKQNIYYRNYELGYYDEAHKKRNITTGVAPELEIRTWKSNNNRKVKVIKVGDRFIHYAPYLWQQHHGEIPPNHMIIFKDKNSENCVIENLEMITMKENAKRNSIMHYPEDVRKVIWLGHKIKNIIKKQNKNSKS